MRHRVGGRKLGLPSDQRKALLRSLVRALLEHDGIITTETRAKEVKRITEKLVTIARRNDIAARRLVREYVDPNVSAFATDADTGKLAANPHYVPARLFNVIAPRYRNRPGGYLRITRIGFRRGDAAPMVKLEFVEGEDVPATDTAQTAVPARGRAGLFRRRKG